MVRRLTRNGTAWARAVGLLVGGPVISLVAMGEDVPEDGAVVLERQPATDMVYQVYQGPDWRAGRIFAAAGAIVEADPAAGPVVARYLDDPATVPPSQLRIEIGFFVHGLFELPPGYARKTLPETEYATLRVEGPYGTAPGEYTRVYDWITRRGYIATGGIMEIYPQLRSASQELTICVPVQKAPVEEPTVPHPPRASLETLLANKDFGAAAEVFLAGSERLDGPRRKWLTATVDRLRVIRAIADSRYGPQSADTTHLIDAVVRRFSEAAAASPPTFAPPASASQDDAARFVKGYLSSQAVEIDRALDRLMVRVHMKAAPAGEVYQKLVAMILDVDRLIHDDDRVFGAHPKAPQEESE